MRVKGIKPIEQHIEKIVVAVIALLFLVVVAVQFVGGPNQVSVDGENVAVHRAFDPVARVANRMQAQATDENPQLPEAAEIGLVAKLEELRTRTVLPDRRIAALGSGVTMGEEFEEEDLAREFRLAELRIPAPQSPMAHAFRNTLDPFAVQANDGLRQVVASGQPYDHPAVTVEAVFDGTHLRELLREDPDPDNPEIRSVPRSWWRDGLEVLAVEVERRHRDPGGEWSSAEQLPDLPGRDGFMEELAESPSVSDMQSLVNRARLNAREIMRPSYFGVIAGPAWMPPSEVRTREAIEGRRSEIDRLLRQYEQQEARVDEARDELENAEGRQRTAQLERRLAREESSLSRYERQLAELGVDPEGEPLTADALADRHRDVRPLLDDDEVRIWTHDIRVEPGREYQYRMRLVINNPVFGRGSFLPSDQRSLARQPVVNSAWSDWSEPTTVEPDEHYFIVSAQTADRPGTSGRATAEVFRFYYGYWRRGTTSLEPGEHIDATLRLPDPNLLPIYSSDFLAEEMDRQQRDTRVAARGRQPAEEGDELPEGAEPGPERLQVTPGVMLLDVARAPGGEAGVGGTSQERFHAFLRDANGNIRVHRPDLDSRSALYRRLRDSDREGRQQGRPEPEPERQERFVPERPERPTEREEGQPGIGGG